MEKKEKRVFTKPDQVQKNFRFHKSVVKKLSEISKKERRTDLATMEILIEEKHAELFPKSNPLNS